MGRRKSGVHARTRDAESVSPSLVSVCVCVYVCVCVCGKRLVERGGVEREREERVRLVMEEVAL